MARRIRASWRRRRTRDGRSTVCRVRVVRGGDAVKRYAANAVTLAGFVLGLAGVVHASIACALLSLACDVLDGRIARGLRIESPFGAALDWSVDVALAHALAWVAFAPFAPAVSAVLVTLQALAMSTRTRVSGRALVTLVWVALSLGGAS